MVLTLLPPSITLPGTSDPPGTPSLDEHLISVQYKRAVTQRLSYAMERFGHKQTTLQRRYKMTSDKQARFRIEVQPGDKIYIDRPPGRVQRPESGTTDPLTVYSDNLEETVTEGSCKLLPRTTGPYTVQSVTGNTATIDNDGLAVPVSLDRATKMPRVPNDAEPIT